MRLMFCLTWSYQDVADQEDINLIPEIHFISLKVEPIDPTEDPYEVQAIEVEEESGDECPEESCSERYSIVHRMVGGPLRVGRQYRCRVCSRTFMKKSDIVNHNRVHTGERPFKCRICSRGFSVRSSLVRHLVQVHKASKDGS
ncbi:zinc finger and BTB domain-containing protein 8A.1-B-like isoform X1 [Haemaphysalis longicornis]